MCRRGICFFAHRWVLCLPGLLCCRSPFWALCRLPERSRWTMHPAAPVSSGLPRLSLTCRCPHSFRPSSPCRSLEELRVPACKPYVSPEALARASLEAIQQNPHPLGQQLPNPVAAAQQQAAMAAMGGRGGHGGPHGGGMRGPHPRDVGPSGLAPSAMPFVPGSAGAGGSGSFRASGEPVRYSAPGSMPLLGGSPGADPYGHMGAGDYGSMGGGHGGPVRQGSYGHPGAMQAQHAQQAAAFQQQQRWAAQQAHQGTYGSMPGNGGGPRGPPVRGPDMAAGSAPADNGMRMAAAARQRSSADGGYYPSAPARVPSPADGHRGFSSFAAVQHPPPQGFGGPAPVPSSQPFGSYQTVDASQPSLGAPAGSGSVHSSRGSDSGSEGESRVGGWVGLKRGKRRRVARRLSTMHKLGCRSWSGSNGCMPAVAAVNQAAAPSPRSPLPPPPLPPAVPRPSTAGPQPAASSGRDSPAVTDDLAQSLASLKIALTQQQLAAAAGSVSWGILAPGGVGCGCVQGSGGRRFCRAGKSQLQGNGQLPACSTSLRLPHPPPARPRSPASLSLSPLLFPPSRTMRWSSPPCTRF